DTFVQSHWLEGICSGAPGAPAIIRQQKNKHWKAILNHAADLGLTSPLGTEGVAFQLHPAIPLLFGPFRSASYSEAEWDWITQSFLGMYESMGRHYAD